MFILLGRGSLAEQTRGECKYSRIVCSSEQRKKSKDAGQYAYSIRSSEDAQNPGNTEKMGYSKSSKRERPKRRSRLPPCSVQAFSPTSVLLLFQFSLFLVSLQKRQKSALPLCPETQKARFWRKPEVILISLLSIARPLPPAQITAAAGTATAASIAAVSGFCRRGGCYSDRVPQFSSPLPATPPGRETRTWQI